MAKRQAESPLEEIANVASPASKKSRVEEEFKDYSTANGTATGLPIRRMNEHQLLSDEQNRNDTTTAYGQEEKELDESEQTHLPPLGVDEDMPAVTAPTRQAAPVAGYDDLYLDTINRSLLDF